MQHVMRTRCRVSPGDQGEIDAGRSGSLRARTGLCLVVGLILQPRACASATGSSTNHIRDAECTSPADRPRCVRVSRRAVGPAQLFSATTPVIVGITNNSALADPGNDLGESSERHGSDTKRLGCHHQGHRFARIETQFASTTSNMYAAQNARPYAMSLQAAANAIAAEKEEPRCERYPEGRPDQAVSSLTRGVIDGCSPKSSGAFGVCIETDSIDFGAVRSKSWSRSTSAVAYQRRGTRRARAEGGGPSVALRAGGTQRLRAEKRSRLSWRLPVATVRCSQPMSRRRQ